jgi:hypothetical protein
MASVHNHFCLRPGGGVRIICTFLRLRSRLLEPQAETGKQASPASSFLAGARNFEHLSVDGDNTLEGQIESRQWFSGQEIAVSFRGMGTLGVFLSLAQIE